jgi:Tfp pilus assembly protein FimT
MRRGFTLIETLIILVITAALLAIAIPRAGAILDRIEVRGAVSEIEMMFAIARQAAIARAAQVTLDIDVARRSLTVKQGAEIIRTRAVGSSHGVVISANRSTITYAPDGLGYGAANLSLFVSRGSVVDTIVVSRLGRVRH